MRLATGLARVIRGTYGPLTCELAIVDGLVPKLVPRLLTGNASMRFGASVVGLSLYRARGHVTAAFRGTRYNMHIKHLPTGCDKTIVNSGRGLINYCASYCISSNNSNWVRMLGFIPFMVI